MKYCVFFALSIFALSCETTSPPIEVTKETPVQMAQPNRTLTSTKTYTTAKDTDLRLSESGDFSFEPATQPLETELSIFVNPGKSFQTLVGIGGAITDASAEVFAKLTPDKQEEFLEAYYGADGIGYSLLRTTIHSSDFGSGSYTYVSDDDKELSTFSVEHDMQYRVPMIKRAIAKSGGALTTYASPWSPPPFMKSNGQMLQGGKLLPEYYESWALYYAKFIKAYEALDIPMWGLTIQNEPMATQRWESCIYTAEEERDFLKNHLGPTLEREGLGDKNIIVWDHNRDLITHRANIILSDPEAAKYAWGTGFHWYENWTGSDPQFENLRRVKESFPDKELMFTEGCNEKFDAAKYEYWPNAERYGRSMINDFNRGTAGWTDWNILLDHNGGPNHVENFCFAPIHADLNTDELVYTPTYYFIGHFSKYIEAGAKRISTVTSRTFLQATTFQNPDGSFATVVFNENDAPYEYSMHIGDQKVALSIPARAIQTLVY